MITLAEETGHTKIPATRGTTPTSRSTVCSWWGGWGWSSDLNWKKKQPKRVPWQLFFFLNCQCNWLSKKSSGSGIVWNCLGGLNLKHKKIVAVVYWPSERWFLLACWMPASYIVFDGLLLFHWCIGNLQQIFDHMPIIEFNLDSKSNGLYHIYNQ